MSNRVVVALGGNALLKPGQRGTIEEYLATIDQTTASLAGMVEDGYQIVVIHGNGPQVGDLMQQNELASAAVPPMPLFVCGAESQGQLGFMLQQGLRNHLRARGLEMSVVTLVTQTVVDESDEGFKKPTKPIGPRYPEAEAKALAKERGYLMKRADRGGWRRVVPSPEPLGIVEGDVIRKLVGDGVVVVACGGGGVPVIEEEQGVLRGVDAVIDKDLAAQLLALKVDAQSMVFLTDVGFAYLNYGKPTAKRLRDISVVELKKYYEEGHFPAGSMGPKVLAAVRFLESGGSRAIITSIEKGRAALKGKAGTQVLPHGTTRQYRKPESR